MLLLNIVFTQHVRLRQYSALHTTDNNSALHKCRDKHTWLACRAASSSLPLNRMKWCAGGVPQEKSLPTTVGPTHVFFNGPMPFRALATTTILHIHTHKGNGIHTQTLYARFAAAPGRSTTAGLASMATAQATQTSGSAA